jgi:hypothetical protein
MRIDVSVARGLALLVGLVFIPACSRRGADDSQTNADFDGDKNPLACAQGGDDGAGRCAADASGTETPPRSDDRVQNGTETDVDCGGANAPKCATGKKCSVDADCEVTCNYAHRCIDTPSCKPHLGGDTCGRGEVDEVGADHESCCRTLPVNGYSDPRHPGKTVYLDKYEITSGRVRAFINAMSATYDGKPNVRDWIVKHPPATWDAAWNKFLPSDSETETVHVARHLLGDVRGYVDSPPIPDTDQDQHVGVDYQFGGELFVYLHGNNCTAFADAFGFPTFFYPADVLAKLDPLFPLPPRADGKTLSGTFVPASEHLEVKSINCITNAMLAAFCHWDGGQLATDDVLDFVTDTPRTGDDALGDAPGCGRQIGSESPPTTAAATKGGRCADLALVNATYDAGGMLPLPNSPLNESHYVYPFFADGTLHDKAWQISAPGRGSLAANGAQVDVVRMKPDDEPWMDLHGNLNEAVLTMSGERFSGRFGLKYRGIGYESARSDLNFKNDWPGEGGIRRIERPEARAAFTGGRCMRFK